MGIVRAAFGAADKAEVFVARHQKSADHFTAQVKLNPLEAPNPLTFRDDYLFRRDGGAVFQERAHVVETAAADLGRPFTLPETRDRHEHAVVPGLFERTCRQNFHGVDVLLAILRGGGVEENIGFPAPPTGGAGEDGRYKHER
jgi:hypothetical protein